MISHTFLHDVIGFRINSNPKIKYKTKSFSFIFVLLFIVLNNAFKAWVLFHTYHMLINTINNCVHESIFTSRTWMPLSLFHHRGHWLHSDIIYNSYIWGIITLSFNMTKYLRWNDLLWVDKYSTVFESILAPFNGPCVSRLSWHPDATRWQPQPACQHGSTGWLRDLRAIPAAQRDPGERRPGPKANTEHISRGKPGMAV